MADYSRKSNRAQEASDSAREQRAADLGARGYSAVLRAQPRSGYVQMGAGKGSPAVRLHRPCGAAVIDPVVHDRYCPALHADTAGDGMDN